MVSSWQINYGRNYWSGDLIKVPILGPSALAKDPLFKSIIARRCVLRSVPLYYLQPVYIEKEWVYKRVNQPMVSCRVEPPEFVILTKLTPLLFAVHADIITAIR